MYDDPLDEKAWEVILTGALRERALSAIKGINDGLSVFDRESLPEWERLALAYDIALLTDYKCRSGHECKGNDTEMIEHILNSANESLSRLYTFNRFHNGLYGGLANFGWTIEHLVHQDRNGRKVQSFDDDGGTDDTNEVIDQRLIGLLSSGMPGPHYDLISGTIGFGVYFLERIPCASAYDGLVCVLDDLEKTAIHFPGGGIAWYTPARFITDSSQKERYPEGYYNLGIAHGMPAVVYLLSEMVALGIERDRSKTLLEESVFWLLSREQNKDSPWRFGYSYSDKYNPPEGRLAWCYGDLGIAAALSQAAKRQRREDWQESAMKILSGCLLTPSKASRVVDAPLCHGAVGVAHIYNRIFQESGDQRYKGAATYWYEATLSMKRTGRGIGGFQTYRGEEKGWVDDPNFLAGAIGICLALISACYPISPDWDRRMLLSTRNWEEMLKH